MDERLNLLIAELEDLLQGLKALQKLNDGFKGMGANILIEEACSVDMALFKMARLIKKFNKKDNNEQK